MAALAQREGGPAGVLVFSEDASVAPNRLTIPDTCNPSPVRLMAVLAAAVVAVDASTRQLPLRNFSIGG